MSRKNNNVFNLDDGKQENVMGRFDKTIGKINKIDFTLKESPYGKLFFKAYKLMRKGLLICGLLTNAVKLINKTQN